MWIEQDGDCCEYEKIDNKITDHRLYSVAYDGQSDGRIAFFCQIQYAGERDGYGFGGRLGGGLHDV